MRFRVHSSYPASPAVPDKDDRLIEAQGDIINQLVEVIENTGIQMDKKLKELLGHSPVEVAAGAVLGIVIAVVAARLQGA